MSEPQWLTIEAAAARFGRSRPTIQRWIRKGVVDTRRVRRRGEHGRFGISVLVSTKSLVKAEKTNRLNKRGKRADPPSGDLW